MKGYWRIWAQRGAFGVILALLLLGASQLGRGLESPVPTALAAAPNPVPTIDPSRSCGAPLAPVPPGVPAPTRDCWIAVDVVGWDLVPTHRDGTTGNQGLDSNAPQYDAQLSPANSALKALVYREYEPNWTAPKPGALTIPGWIAQCYEGEQLRIHLKNNDTLFNWKHSLHAHSVQLTPDNDGVYSVDHPQAGGAVPPGGTFTYTWLCDRGTAGTWPMHDHADHFEESIKKGLFSMLIVRAAGDAAVDQEFVGIMHEMRSGSGLFYFTINGSAYMGNSVEFVSVAGQKIRWRLLAYGDNIHPFHLHGHRFAINGQPRDTISVAPGESYTFDYVESAAPGHWHWHCHVDYHQAHGMVASMEVKSSAGTPTQPSPQAQRSTLPIVQR